MKHRILTSFAAAAMLSSITVPAVGKAVKPAKAQTAQAATLNEQLFLNKAAREAQKAAKKYGIYPSVMIAQAILESNWGQSSLAVQANNLFGMKAGSGWVGASKLANTREESVTGKSYYISAAFRKYNSYEESFEDNGKKIRLGVSWQPLRYSGAWIENASSPAAATKALTGTYATDHKYNQSLDSRIAEYDLTKYDPKISKTAKSYKVAKKAATYAWPTDHSISAKNGSVSKGENVTVDKTITYYNGAKRMHIAGKGWVNSTVFKKHSALPAISQAPKNGTKVSKMLMHNAYVYDGKGKRVTGMKKLKEDSVIPTYGTKTIKKKKYYCVGTNQYIAAGNIDGTMRLLKHNAYVYNGSGNRDNNIVEKKGKSIATYGGSVDIVGQRYYKIGVHQYVRVSNFFKLKA